MTKHPRTLLEGGLTETSDRKAPQDTSEVLTVSEAREVNEVNKVNEVNEVNGAISNLHDSVQSIYRVVVRWLRNKR